MNVSKWRRKGAGWLIPAIICSAISVVSAQQRNTSSAPDRYVPEQLFAIAPIEEAALPGALVPGGRRFARVLGSGEIRIAEFSPEGVSRRDFANPLGERPAFLLPDPAGTHLMVASDGSAGSSEVARLDLESGRAAYRFSLSDGQKISAMAISPRDGSIAALTTGSALLVWNAQSGQQAFAGSPQAAVSLAFSTDGRMLVTSGVDSGRARGIVEFWNPATGERQRRLEMPSIPDFVPSGRLAVNADASVLALQVSFSPSEQSRRSNALMFGLASAAFGGREPALKRLGDVRTNPKLERAFVVLVRAEDGEVLHWLLDHEDEITGVEFSSDGRQVLTASRDWTARSWSVATGAPVSGFLHENENSNQATPPGAPRFLFATFDVEDWGFMPGSVFTRGSNGEVLGWETAQAKQRRRAQEVAAVLPKAQAGDPASMYWLSRVYLTGDGVAADRERGAGWLARAAEAGFSEALWTLGIDALTGESERQDCALAAATIGRASAPTDPDPQVNEVMRSAFEDRSRRLQSAILEPLGGGDGAAALSPQIQADLLEEQMVAALTTSDHPAFLANLCAFEYLGHADRLPVEFRRELLYHRSVGLRATGKPRAALAALNQYLNEAGNTGASYTAAIQMLRPLQEEAKR